MQHDAVIVGGAFAGLAAATYLARARRRVCVIDAREPRNRFADASHGFLGVEFH
jgi:thioredoxin reductase